MSTYPSIDDIDFADLYRRHMAAVRRPKSAEEWDVRAEAMTLPPADTGYTAEFVRRMNLSGCDTLLDVGCGLGNIALAVAPKLSQVYGLDYSPRMLARFAQHAREQGASGAHAILRSWDDDWHDVPVCDIVVASLSTAVMDMADALRKLHAKARKRVYLTSVVNGQPGDASRPAWPDYIYILNILHAMGIHARVDYMAGATSFSAQWAFIAWDVL